MVVFCDATAGLACLVFMLGRRQVVRHRILVPAFGGSNPPAPASYFRRVWGFLASGAGCKYRMMGYQQKAAWEDSK